ncbi:hypothetical protein ANN_10619 [Periplaneta americana]|uniref:Reverse transcriptase domain-containing protein n=1 Tax=Periplaneta americana TaxID=6978 RepID=A0ABQ8TPK4_PERAM|nr:hypothetical protein ANN_10619 [Periplaneta americana]
MAVKTWERKQASINANLKQTQCSTRQNDSNENAHPNKIYHRSPILVIMVIQYLECWTYNPVDLGSIPGVSPIYNVLAKPVIQPSTTTLISNILAENYIQIDDGVGTSDWLPQTNGILQGDPLSPILFNVLTHDVTKGMEGVSTYIYADDMAIAATDLDNIQSALDTLSKWTEQNDIKINEEKTELVVFRKGGRLTEEENVKCNGKQLKRTSDFKYLGITIQTTGKSFRLHIRSRVMAATRAMNEIRNITQLSISTAMDLFRIKILPILTYGLESVGEYLTYKQMEELERVKARYLKRALGLPQNARSRLVYELTRETFLIEDLRCEIMLPANDAYKRLLQDLHEKKTSIPEEFYATCAMFPNIMFSYFIVFRHPVGEIELSAAFCYELQASGKSRPQRIPTSFDVPTSDGSLPKANQTIGLPLLRRTQYRFQSTNAIVCRSFVVRSLSVYAP